MSKLGLVITLLLMAGAAMAQNYPKDGISNLGSEARNYFVLITADENQAFYVRIDSEAHNSSPGGHLILAPLRDSNYIITIGFPGQKYPEQRFQLDIQGRDLALSLSRRSGAWGLYDSKGQPLSAAPDPLAGEERLMAGVKKDDAFSQMMSAIVRDTAVMYNNYAVSTSDHAASDTPGQAARSSLPVSSPDSPRGSSPGSTPGLSSTQAFATTGSPAIPPPFGSAPSSPTGVVKLREFKSTGSLNLVFADHSNSRSTDTIDVVIPVDSPASAAHPRHLAGDSLYPAAAGPGSSRSAGSDSPSAARSDTPRDARSDSPRVTRSARHADSSTRHAGLPFVNSDCHDFATGYDVDRLRTRMLDAGKNDERIQIARKVFKTKCFSTKQVRLLSEVFASEAWKLKFLEAAYPFVSDARFPELIDLFRDPAYAGKFRSLTERR